MIKAGATIGIVGGGQLGRMLAMAAAHMGYRTCIFTPEKDSPASHVATVTIVADYQDQEALAQFARQVDVVTFEFENIPPESLQQLQSRVSVFPDPSVLHICRNRLREKHFVQDLGIPTAPFHAVRSLADLREGVKQLGLPCVLKTTELGYDGKGQVKIESADTIEAAWEQLKTGEAVLEGWVPFEREISVIVARDASGSTQAYDPVHNIHRHHILAETHVPAGISDEAAQKARAVAQAIASGIGLIGLLAVEMFLEADGTVRVNELAPRPHNSGHWTLDAAATSQFEQQVRAICGLGLGDPRALCSAIMYNLIGDEVLSLDAYYSNPQAHIHLYGKREVKAGRKMGHVTVLGG